MSTEQTEDQVATYFMCVQLWQEQCEVVYCRIFQGVQVSIQSLKYICMLYLFIKLIENTNIYISLVNFYFISKLMFNLLSIVL